MKVLDFMLSELTPYGKNPRKTDKAVDYVAESIRQFGFRVPLVIDRDHVIVCGHVRYRAAKKLKLEKVPCIIADDLTPEQITAFRLIDNKTQELSTWDFAKLIDELDMLVGEFDMKSLGFNQRRQRSSGEDDEVAEQDIDDSEELDLDDFDDEQFTCTCPSCGFRFNE